MMKPTHTHRTWWLLTLAGWLWVLLALLPGHHLGWPCLFRFLTGMPCPGCGATRAMLCVLHGRVAEAILINPVGPLALCALVVVPLWLLTDRFVCRRDTFAAAGRWLAAQRYAVPLAVAATLAGWLWNLAKAGCLPLHLDCAGWCV